MPKAFNAVTEEINRLDIESSPIFKRLFEQAGFLLIKTGDLENFLNTEGLKLLVFADDPNERKITMDIAVIAPEIKKAFGDTLSLAAWANFKEARSMAARWGLRSLPAVAVFSHKDLLGAVQGLKTWGEYCSLLSEILTKNRPVARTIAILPAARSEGSEGQESVEV